MNLLQRRCMSCTKNPAVVTLAGNFLQYAWCEHCWRELEGSIASMKSMIGNKQYVSIGEPITEPLVYSDPKVKR